MASARFRPAARKSASRRGQLQELVRVRRPRVRRSRPPTTCSSWRVPAELLRPFRVVPDARLLELPNYFLQTLLLVVVIKDTSSKSRCAPRDL